MSQDPHRDDKSTVKRRSLTRPTEARRRALRVVYSTDHSAIGRFFELDTAALVIGRGTNEEISIGDARMSRRHARIAPNKDGTGHVVEDLGAANGTFLDGNRITERAALEPSSVLSIGDTLLVLDEEPDPEGLPANPSADGDAVPELLGISYLAERLRRAIVTAARGEGAVLLLGATGVGKEVAAAAIHRVGPRSKGPYVTANCAAIPTDLAEAKLFGTARGDYTGSIDKRGVFDEADTGVLFLDEIGDLPAAMQPKLLRVLENGSIQSLTGAGERTVDVRVVAATHVELEAVGFRRDLLGRFTWTLNLPPLAARKADILLLFEHFLAKLRPNAGPSAYTAELAEALLLQSWPMNVREVRNLAERLVSSAAPNEVLDIYLLPPAWQEKILERATEEEEPETEEGAVARPSKAQLEAALAGTEGNVLLAAQQNGWARTQLYRWLRYARINPNKFRK